MEYYLKHHGIKGQKWGKQNGPPYPLDGNDHSASEKKAGWRQSLKAKIDSAKEKYRVKKETKKRNEEIYKLYKKNRTFKDKVIDKVTNTKKSDVVKYMTKENADLNTSLKEVRKEKGMLGAAHTAYKGYMLYKNKEKYAALLKTAINIAGIAYVSSKAYQSYQKHLQNGTLLVQKHEWERAPVDVDWRYVK